jgi:hypothetical protein
LKVYFPDGDTRAAAEQLPKGRLVPLFPELVEEMLIGHLPLARVFDDAADRFQDQAAHGLGHHGVPIGRKRLSTR